VPLESGRLKHESSWLRLPFSIGFVDELDLIRGTSGRLYAKILASSPKPFRAPAARPKGANDEEVRESPGIVCDHDVFIGLRLARSGPLLRRRLPYFYDEQEHTAPERNGCEGRAGEIHAQRERAGLKCESRADSHEFRTVASFPGARAVMPKPRPQLPPRPRGAACAPQSLFRQFPPEQNRSARTPSSSFRAPASWKSARWRSSAFPKKAPTP
jgi:hypothetical protein